MPVAADSVSPVIAWRAGVVDAVGAGWPGAVELTVTVTGAPADGPVGARRLGVGTTVRALAYPALVGAPEVGDRVLLNVTALVLGLGTGGYALVVAVPERLPADPPGLAAGRAGGHLVKARYTPLQTVSLGVDEESSPHRAVLEQADDLAGLPVVTADLHSALPAILAGVHADAPGARVGYVLTDGGALPAWFSRSLARLRELAGRRGDGGSGVRRRSSRRPPCTPACSPPGTCWARTWWWWRRGRGTWVPVPGGASPGWRWVRR